APPRAQAEGDLRHLAGRTGMVGRELAAFLGLAVAAPAGGEDHCTGLDLVLAAPRVPPVLAALEARERALRKRGPAARLPCLAQGGRDRVTGAIADLQQPLPARAAAARQPVTPVVPRELDAELLEPVDGALRLARQHLDELPVGGLVRTLPDVHGVDLRRVVLAERRLDPALRLRRVAGLQRSLRGQRDPRLGAFSGDCGGEPGGPATDHEHVERQAPNHRARITNPRHYGNLLPLQ